MPILKNQTRLLNDLILINNDRVVGYQKAMDELKDEDADLKLLFQEKVNQSNEFKAELTEMVIKTGHEVVTGTTNAGKIYRVWMDVKAFFGGFDRKVVLDNCENVENAALIAYNDPYTINVYLHTDLEGRQSAEGWLYIDDGDTFNQTEK